MTRALTAGIDVGTTNVKVALVAIDARGEAHVVARAAAGHAISRPAPGRVEQSPAAWWEATSRALASLGEDMAGVSGISVSGQGSTVTLCGPSGENPSTAIGWQDVRAADDAAELDRRLRRELDRAHGNQTGDAAEPKLRWLDTHEPELSAGADRALTAAAWVQARLGGAAILNEADAGAWMSWNRHERRWDPALADLLDVARLLPPVGFAGETVGRVSDDAAHATGLPTGATLVLGTSDVAAAAVSAGIGQPGEVAYSKGTGGFACCYVGPVSDPSPLLALPAIVPDALQLCGAVNTLGAAWDWARKLTGDLDHSAAERLAANADLAAVPLFVPWLSGAAHPVVDQGARAAFARLSLEAGPGEVLRSVLEGAAAELGGQLAAARAVSGHGFDLVVSTGGPTRSSLWNRLDAAAAQAPVVVAPMSDAAVGGALIAAEALGLVESAIACGRRLRAGGAVYEPEAALSERAALIAADLAPVQGLALELSPVARGAAALRAQAEAADG